MKSIFENGWTPARMHWSGTLASLGQEMPPCPEGQFHNMETHTCEDLPAPAPAAPEPSAPPAEAPSEFPLGTVLAVGGVAAAAGVAFLLLR